MKRLPRNPLRFDPVELYTAISRDLDYKIEAETDHKDFLEKVGASLKTSVQNPNILHGKRVEALFAHVAGALDRCKFIKQEDSGAMFSDGKNLQAPDYSLILKDGRRFMVEVKNCHDSDPNYKFILKKDYMERLENYADMHGASLKIAIYFSRMNRWVLLSKESLSQKGNKFYTTFIEAFPRSEMIELGDRMIGTIPNLSFELLSSTSKEAFVTDDDQASFTVGDVKIYCANKEITDDLEMRIAFYLIRFGRWTTDLPTAITEDKRLLSIRYEFYPECGWDEDQGFALVGELSSMVSSAYNELTVYENRVIALDVKVDPEIFKVFIPDGYKGQRLPLWQLLIQPNQNCVHHP
ncbi:hypothetical protein WKQ99_10235 [Pseudomonas atacamensis]|uniref:hypothetical protein n=1 Tax=Pseudomonas atacamensis TaxID=2565368 RepID=UPI0030D07E4C